MEKRQMRWSPSRFALLILLAYGAGFFSHLFYERWTSAESGERGYEVDYVPFAEPPAPAEIPQVEAFDIARLRAIAGTRARVRGRIYRVGHSSKSNTYFLNFGPSQSSLTGVIFASALGRFEDQGIDPRKEYEGREVEITGRVKDHPQYGLEMILEDPSQIAVIR